MKLDNITKFWFGPRYDRKLTTESKQKNGLESPDVYRDCLQVEIKLDEFSIYDREATEKDKRHPAYKVYEEAKAFEDFKASKGKTAIPRLVEPVDTLPEAKTIFGRKGK